MSWHYFPVAPSLDHALKAIMTHGDDSSSPIPLAKIASEAQEKLGEAAVFISIIIPIDYETEQAAYQAYEQVPNDLKHAIQIIACLADPALGRLPASKMRTEGEKRWGSHEADLKVVWRARLSFWTLEKNHATAPKRPNRGKKQAQNFTKDDLKQFTNAPLRPEKPQKSLDYGLFDFIPPDDPTIIIADE